MKQIKVEEFLKLMPQFSSGDVIVDVREEEEYQEAHVPGSINVPLVSIGKHLDELHNYKNIYVVCESGGRSYYANELLASIGVETTNIIGGISALNNAGLILETTK